MVKTQMGITNNTAVNIVEQIPCSMIDHPLCICPRMLLLGPEVG